MKEENEDVHVDDFIYKTLTNTWVYNPYLLNQKTGFVATLTAPDQSVPLNIKED